MPTTESNSVCSEISLVITQVVFPTASAIALETSDYGPFKLSICADHDEMVSRWAEGHCTAIILVDNNTLNARALVADAARDTAILVVVRATAAAVVVDWLQHGAQDVLLFEELAAASLPQRLRAAIERKRIEREARRDYSTDLDTGLPHQQQLIEHMSQLIALREREPSPMAVLVLRIEGFATVRARNGSASANVLRRKVAVRLRAGVRASDVVAFLGDDCYAVLLGAMLAPTDATGVGAKLLRALLQPFTVTGNDVILAVSLGMARYPEDGAQPEILLRRALELATLTPVQGRIGMANFQETGGIALPAANDD